jgi:TATA-binding protein-associated factor
VSITPVFAVGPDATEGILSLKEDKQSAPKRTAAGLKEMPEETEQQIASRVTRRGALESFKALADRFGEKLFERVPQIWGDISAPLVAIFEEGNLAFRSARKSAEASGVSIEDADARLAEKTSTGQDLIDALTTLRYLAPMLNASLHERVASLLPPIIGCLSSTFAVIRSTASKCLAALCDIMTEDAMKKIVDDVVPLVGDAKRTASRQGAVEAIHRQSL